MEKPLAVKQFGTKERGSDTQKVSKPNGHFSGRHSRTDLRYCEKAIFQSTYTRNGQVRKVGEWAAKIQHVGRREAFSIGSANKRARLRAHQRLLRDAVAVHGGQEVKWTQIAGRTSLFCEEAYRTPILRRAFPFREGGSPRFAALQMAGEESR